MFLNKERYTGSLQPGAVRKENKSRGFTGSWAWRNGKSLPSEGHHALGLATPAPRQLEAASPQIASEAPWPRPQQRWSVGSSASWKGESQVRRLGLPHGAQGHAPDLSLRIARHMHCSSVTVHKYCSHLPALHGTERSLFPFSKIQLLYLRRTLCPFITPVKLLWDL